MSKAFENHYTIIWHLLGRFAFPTMVYSRRCVEVADKKCKHIWYYLELLRITVLKHCLQKNDLPSESKDDETTIFGICTLRKYSKSPMRVTSLAVPFSSTMRRGFDYIILAPERHFVAVFEFLREWCFILFHACQGWGFWYWDNRIQKQDYYKKIRH